MVHPGVDMSLYKSLLSVCPTSGRSIENKQWLLCLAGQILFFVPVYFGNSVEQ